mmetsp:Transcript_32256/g.97220  ORF Transcript_32256/g.97220 Transcript_32256/m.97220 type:complete len:215 (-) Transcript_32256:1170-1814(-)
MPRASLPSIALALAACALVGLHTWSPVPTTRGGGLGVGVGRSATENAQPQPPPRRQQRRSRGVGSVTAISTGPVVFTVAEINGGVTPHPTPMLEPGCRERVANMSNPPLNAELTNHGWGVDIVAVLGRMRDAWRERKPNWVEMPLRVWGEESKTSRVDYWHYSLGYPVKKKVRFEDIGPTVAATPYVYTAAPVCKNKDLSCYFKPVPCSPPRQV